MENIILTDHFILENNTPEEVTITAKSRDNIDYYEFDFGNRTNKEDLHASFIFSSEKYKITNNSAGCGCTYLTHTNLGDNKQLVVVNFRKGDIKTNVSKWFTLYLNRGEDSVKFNLLVNRQ